MKKQLFAGIDLGGTRIKYGLVNEKGKIIYHDSYPTGKTRKKIISQFAEVVDELTQQAEERKSQFNTLGIGSPGHVDTEQGKVVSGSPNVRQWRGTDIKGDLSKLLTGKQRLQIYVDNDANAMALAEHTYGAGKEITSGLYLTVGTGLGSGIILNNIMWRGHRFAGAEVGHSIIVKDGIKCQCGKQGCLEMYVNSDSFVRYFGVDAPRDADAKWVFDRAAEGDRRARAAIEQSADFLACGIGSVLEILNPEIVVIGGGVSHGGKPYLDVVRKQLPRYTSKAAAKSVSIVPAALGNQAGLLGAAMLPRESELLLK